MMYWFCYHMELFFDFWEYEAAMYRKANPETRTTIYGEVKEWA